MAKNNNFEVLVQTRLDLSKIQGDIDRIKKKFGNIEFSVDFSKVMGDSKVGSAGAKAGKTYSDAFKAQMDSKIQFKIETKDFQTKIDLISTKMESLGHISSSVKSNFDILKTSFNTMTSSKSTIEEKIQAFQTFNSILPTIRSQLNLTAQEEKIYASSIREAAQEQKILSQSTTLSNEIQTWMNQNTKAAELYGNTLRDLQNQLKNNTDPSKLSEVSLKFKEIKSEARASGVAVSQFGLNFKQAILYAMGIGSLNQIIMKCIQLTKEMVEQTVKLDSAMAQLKIVTNATNKEYENFKNNIFSISKEISGSATDLIDSSTTFARLGFSLDESETLAKYTTMLQNVGDIDVSSAQDALTALFKAFDININDIEKVMDKLITVGNNYPISVEELATGINNAGSMMASAGNSYEETFAMLAAANTTVQDISKSSTGLRTIAARIRNTRTELDDLGEAMTDVEYDELVQGLTKYNVSLTDAQGNFRSTYDIIKDLSKVWEDLDSVEQAALAKTLAGTRQQNVFYSLISQFQEAEGAMQSMSDSAGELEGAYAKFQETTQAHANTFKAAFVELADAIVNSGVLNFFIDLGTSLVEGATAVTQFIDKIGGFRTVILAVAAALLIAKGYLIAYKIELIATAAIQKIITFFGAVKTAITNIIQIIPTAVAAWQAYAAGTVTASAAMQASIPVIGLVLAGLTLLSVGIATASSAAEDGAESTSQATEEVTQNIKQLSNAAKESTQQLSKLAVSYVNAEASLDGLAKTTANYKTATDNLRKGLKIEQSELQALIDKYGDYDTALKKATINKLKENAIDLRGGVDAAFADLDEANTSTIAAGKIFHLDELGGDIEREIRDAMAEFENMPIDVQMRVDWIRDEHMQDNGDGTYTLRSVAFTNQDPTDEEIAAYGSEHNADLIKQYKTFQAALKVLADTVGTENYLYKQIYASYSQIKEPAEEVISTIEALNENLVTQYLLENDLLDNVPQTADEFKAFRKELLAGVVASGKFEGTQEDISGAIDNVLSQSDGFSQFYNNSEKAVEKFVSRAEELTSALDDLQSTYSDIQDIQENFNNNGYYSTDDLQKLLELEPEYLNLLIDENGQLNLNSEAYKTYMAAKAKSLLIDQVTSLYESILGMSIEEAQAYAAAEAYDEESESIANLTQQYLNLAKAKDIANNTTAYTDAIKRSYGTVANYAAIYDSWLSSLNSDTNEFTKNTNSATSALEAQKDALEAQKDALEDYKDSLEDAKDALEDYKDELEDAQSNLQSLIDLTMDYIKQTKEDEKTALEDSKSALEDKKDALDDQIDAYSELISKRKEEIEALYDEKEAQDELSEKQKSAAKDALALAIANLDDSSAGKKNQKQARDKYAESSKDLKDYLDEQAKDKRIAALEEEEEAYEAMIERQKAAIDEQIKHIEDKIDEIDAYLDNERKIYEDACKMIDNDNGTLYANLWDYTYTYTTKTRAEFDKLWSDAQTAIQKYKGDNDTLIGTMETLQRKIYDTDDQIADLSLQIDECETQIGYLDDAISATSDAISATSDSIDAVSTSLDGLGTSITDYMEQLNALADAEANVGNNNGTKTTFWVTHNGKTYETTLNGEDTTSNRLLAASKLTKQIAQDVSGFDTYGLGIVQGYLGVGNSNAKEWYFDWDGKRYTAVSKTKGNAVQQILQQLGWDSRGGYKISQNIKHYAGGTKSSNSGLSVTQEDGLEAIFGKLSRGQYTLMPQGSQVFTAAQTDSLYSFASDPQKYLSSVLGRMSSFMSSRYGNPSNGLDTVTNKVTNNGGDVSIDYSPTYQIQGSVDDATLQKIDKQERKRYELFKKQFMLDMLRENNNL